MASASIPRFHAKNEGHRSFECRHQPLSAVHSRKGLGGGISPARERDDYHTRAEWGMKEEHVKITTANLWVCIRLARA